MSFAARKSSSTRIWLSSTAFSPSDSTNKSNGTAAAFRAISCSGKRKSDSVRGLITVPRSPKVAYSFVRRAAGLHRAAGWRAGATDQRHAGSAWIDVLGLALATPSALAQATAAPTEDLAQLRAPRQSTNNCLIRPAVAWEFACRTRLFSSPAPRAWWAMLP